MGFQLFDRISAFFRSRSIATPEKTIYDQGDINKLAGTLFSGTNRFIIEQTNLSLNRLQRYRDYSQMDQIGEISLALDLFADEASLIDPEIKRSVLIKARDKTVKQELEHFFYNILDIDREIRPAMRYLCKYGDFAWEIIPAEDRSGVAAIRFLNIYNFTRVETKFGDLVGFYYQDSIDGNPQFLHPWQCSHLRLTSFENIFFPYGRAIIEPARKVFKQLRLMEDSAIVYRLCLRGDTQVWTSNGNKTIKDIEKNDVVYSYDENGELIPNKVVYKTHNGKDEIFRVKTQYHEIYGNKTHPILVQDGQIIRYVDIKDLNPQKHKIIAPIRNTISKHKFKMLSKGKTYKLAENKLPAIRIQDLLSITDRYNITEQKLVNFLQGKISILEIDYKRIKKSLPKIELKAQSECRNKEQYGIYINEDLDKEFMKFLGYFIGSAYINKFKNGSSIIGLIGNDEWFIKSFKYYFKYYRSRDYDNKKLFYYSGRSNKIVNLLLLNNISVNKNTVRVPQWISIIDSDLRDAFIRGILESNISTKDGDKYVIKSNQLMLLSLRDLVLETGYKAQIDDNKLIIELNRREIYESIISIEQVEDANIYDIGVESKKHNFIANGIVVHNTRAPEKRIFTIPVGHVPAHEIDEYVRAQAMKLKKRQYLEPGFNDISERWNPMIAQDDYFLPERPDGTKPQIDTLKGAENLDDIKDIEYFKKKMISALKIPFNRVGIGEQPTDAQQSLSQVSPEFAKAVQWIQREAVSGLKKLAFIHLALRGFNEDQIRHFELYMTAGSAIDELYRIETWNSRAGIIKELLEAGLLPKYVYSRFTDLTDDEIDEIEEKQKQKAEAEQLSAATDEEGGGLLGGLVENKHQLLKFKYKNRHNIKPKIKPIINNYDKYIINNELSGIPKTKILTENINLADDEIEESKKDAQKFINEEKQQYEKELKEDVYYKILNKNIDDDPNTITITDLPA